MEKKRKNKAEKLADQKMEEVRGGASIQGPFCIACGADLAYVKRGPDGLLCAACYEAKQNSQ